LLKLKITFKRSLVFPEELILEPKIFFGKLLFFDVINTEDPFVLQEWYRFKVLSKKGHQESVDDCSCDNGELYSSKTCNIEFQQSSLEIWENFKIFLQKFDFKLDREHVVQGEKRESRHLLCSRRT